MASESAQRNRGRSEEPEIYSQSDGGMASLFSYAIPAPRNAARLFQNLELQIAKRNLVTFRLQADISVP